jgi:hypothetical protein
MPGLEIVTMHAYLCEEERNWRCETYDRRQGLLQKKTGKKSAGTTQKRPRKLGQNSSHRKQRQTKKAIMLNIESNTLPQAIRTLNPITFYLQIDGERSSWTLLNEDASQAPVLSQQKRPNLSIESKR